MTDRNQNQSGADDQSRSRHRVFHPIPFALACILLGAVVASGLFWGFGSKSTSGSSVTTTDAMATPKCLCDQPAAWWVNMPLPRLRPPQHPPVVVVTKVITKVVKVVTPPPRVVNVDMPTAYCDVCDMFKDAGGDTNYQEPVVVPQKVYKADVVPSGSSTGASSGQSCFWVLNKRPTAMVLHEGGGPANPGSHGLVSWRPDSGKWQPSRYYPGFVTRQICMPNSALNAAETVSICGDVGYQNFKHSDGVVQQIIAARNSPESDPACIAGHVCPPGLR